MHFISQAAVQLTVVGELKRFGCICLKCHRIQAGGWWFQTEGKAGTKLTSSDVGGDVYVSVETEERQRRSAQQTRCSNGGPKERRLKLKRQRKHMRLLKWLEKTPVNEISQQLLLKEAINTSRSIKPSLTGIKKATFPCLLVLPPLLFDISSLLTGHTLTFDG